MAEITRHSGKNTGGICCLQWAYTDNIASMEKDFEDLTALISFSNGGWEEVYYTPGTITLQENQVTTDAGIRYDYTLTLRIPKDRASVATTLFARRYRDFILRITNANELVRLLGTDEVPMRMGQQMLWPGEVSGFNGYEIRFTGSFPQPAFFEGAASGSGSAS